MPQFITIGAEKYSIPTASEAQTEFEQQHIEILQAVATELAASDTAEAAILSDLASTAANKGASLIGVRDAGALYAAATVEAALAEVKAIADAAAVAADLAATTTGNGAALIGIEDAGTLYTAADVEAALAEVKTIADAAAVAADLAATTNGNGASLIGIEDAGTLYTAANVEAALAEVKTLADAAATKASILKITLTPAAEAGDAIVVSGVVEDLAGLDVAVAKEVYVQTLAVTDGKGDITVTDGTSKKVVNPATGPNVAWITTDADGTFAFSVANDVAEDVLVEVTCNGALAATLKLTFL